MYRSSTSFHLDHAEVAGEPLRASTHPSYMGVLLAVAVYHIESIPYAGGAYRWALGSAASMEVSGMALGQLLTTLVAALLLLLAGRHTRFSLSPAEREMTRWRLLFWVPLGRRTWRFTEARRFTTKSPPLRLQKSDDSDIADLALLGANPVALVLVVAGYAAWLFWDTLTPYRLYLVTAEHDWILVGSSINGRALSARGRHLARAAGARYP